MARVRSTVLAPAKYAPEALTEWQVDAILLGGIVAIAVLFDWLFASRAFFFGDDFVVFWQSQTHRLGLDYLTSGATAHFSPPHRLITWALARVAPLDFNVALALLLGFHAISIVLVQRTLALLFGRAWWTFAIALTFGLSMIYVSAMWWFSPALLALPSLTFALACIHAHLWWRASRRRDWLIWSVISLCVALLFYEKAVLVPVYLVLMRVLLLDQRPLAISLRTTAAEWRVWLLYVLPVVAYLAIVIPGDYQGGSGLRLDLVPDYLHIAWLRGFAPAVFGVAVPKQNPTMWHEIAVVAAQTAIVATVVVSIARRASAWRAWAFLGAGFLLNALLVIPRLGPWGPEIGYVTRYYTETAALVPFAIAFAFKAPRDPGKRGTSVLHWPRGAVAVATVAGLAAYVGLVAWGDHETVYGSTGRQVRPWVERVEAGLRDARRLDAKPTLLDAQAPDAVVVSFSKPPANYLSAVVPTFDNNVQFNIVSPRTYRVADDGSLRSVSFIPTFGGSLSGLRRARSATLGGGTWKRVGPVTCIVAGRGPARLRIQPRRVLMGHPWWMRLSYGTHPSAGLDLKTNIGLGYGPKSSIQIPAAPGGAARLVSIASLPGIPKLAGIEIEVPTGVTACFDSIDFGWFRDAPTQPASR